METVSVIIPVYNNEKQIEKCVRSVLGQSYRALEVIAVDDGSTDGSGRLLDKLAGSDSRLRVLHQENKGTSAARNAGLLLARGTYLTFVDGDDYLGVHYIQSLAEHMEKTGADMVICGVTVEDEAGRELQKIVPGEYVRFQREEWVSRISAVWSHFYRRALWERYPVSFFEGVRGEDMPVALFFSAVCERIFTLPQAEYHYVQHDASAMHQFRGLKNYRLPYQALEEAIKKARAAGVKNSETFFELFAMRILATCFFQLGRGADREHMRELTDYVVRILNSYFPGYFQNPLAGLFSGAQYPFSQKAAVWLLKLLVKTKWIYPVSRLLEGKMRSIK